MITVFRINRIKEQVCQLGVKQTFHKLGDEPNVKIALSPKATTNNISHFSYLFDGCIKIVEERNFFVSFTRNWILENFLFI